MVSTKKTKVTKKGSKEELTRLLKIELLEVEAKFLEAVAEKFNEVINNYSLSPEECVELFREDRSKLEVAYSPGYFISVLDELYNYAEHQYETDIENGDDCGFHFPFTVVSEKVADNTHEEILQLKSQLG